MIKKMLLFLIVLMVGASNVFAQGTVNKINILISVKCAGSGQQLIMWNDTIREGESYAIKAKELTAPFQSIQPLYNAFVGTYIQFEDGSLSEDIQVRLTFDNINCATGLFTPDNLAKFLMYWRLEVYDFQGLDPKPSPYNFGTGKAFKIVIVRTPSLNGILATVGLNWNTLRFAFQIAPGFYSLTGITQTQNNDSIVIRAAHFSVIVGSEDGVLSADDASNNLPVAFNLHQNYPNPFNPSTTIKYDVPFRSDVTVKIYNVVGNLVAELVNENKDAGTYEISFNAGDIPSGVYFYELRAGTVVQSRKMILMK